ncbi:MAG: MobA/MobL family protein, partial [Selenomonadaceae bacterium]|nr:MobA/MobL family protein [Selenomonadaceae bacterium]
MRAYRELRFALQEEFTLAENIELVEKLISECGIRENHAYSYAIHDKTATFDKEHRNIHCHLMFNEKIIEQDRPLPANKFFKQYAVDHDGNPVSGYRTSDYFKQKDATLSLRHRWAELCNEKFAEKGLSCRISEKSLSTQKENLLAEGKIEEAVLLDRTPAPHLGSSYRNPRTLERIMEEAELAEHTAEEYIDAHEEVFDGLPPKDLPNLPVPSSLGKTISMEKNPKEQASDSSEETYENESSPNEQDVSHSEGKSIAKKQ